MRKLLCALAACATTFAGASAVHADTYLPASSTSVFTGLLQLGSGPVVVNCTVQITVATNGAGTDASVTAASVTGGMICPTLLPAGLPWNIDVVAPLPPPFNITATQIQATGVTIGSCTGTLVGNWSTTGPTITFPPGSMLGSCAVRGSLVRSSGAVLAITN